MKSILIPRGFCLAASKLNPLLRPALALGLFALSASWANAQATRTWVSGVGDDVNPCSRTAPCRTFAGAISKTAAGGEIDVLDPNGAGTVTIVKSITLAADGDFGGILASMANGIVINAAATDTVVIRGLHIEGAKTGLNGIRFIGGGTLVVDNCRINGFAGSPGNGIDFQPTIAGARLIVRNSLISNSTGTGIEIKPSVVDPTTRATVEKSQIVNCGPGLRAQNGAKVTVHDSVASENLYAGFSTRTGAELTLDNCVASNNRWGLRADSSTIRYSETSVSGNNESGLSLVGSGALVSFGDNKVAGNAVDGSATALMPKQ